MGGKSLKRDVARVIDAALADTEHQCDNAHFIADSLAPVVEAHAAERAALVARLARAERFIADLAWTVTAEFMVAGEDEMRQNPRLRKSERLVGSANKFLKKGLRPKMRRRKRRR